MFRSSLLLQLINVTVLVRCYEPTTTHTDTYTSSCLTLSRYCFCLIFFDFYVSRLLLLPAVACLTYPCQNKDGIRRYGSPSFTKFIQQNAILIQSVSSGFKSQDQQRGPQYVLCAVIREQTGANDPKEIIRQNLNCQNT